MKPIAKIKAGAVFLVALENGEIMPIQVIEQLKKQSLSTCALIGRTYKNSGAAKDAMPQLKNSDVVAIITVPTKSILDHDGNAWESIGVFPVLLVGRSPEIRVRMADFVRKKLGIKDEGTRFCTVGILYALANACVGIRRWDSMAAPDFFEQFLTDKDSPLVRKKL